MSNQDGCANCDAMFAKLEDARQRIARLTEALTAIVEDMEARWDMRAPSTNPGIVTCVENAKLALAPDPTTETT